MPEFSEDEPGHETDGSIGAENPYLGGWSRPHLDAATGDLIIKHHLKDGIVFAHIFQNSNEVKIEYKPERETTHEMDGQVGEAALQAFMEWQALEVQHTRATEKKIAQQTAKKVAPPVPMHHGADLPELIANPAPSVGGESIEVVETQKEAITTSAVVGSIDGALRNGRKIKVTLRKDEQGIHYKESTDIEAANGKTLSPAELVEAVQSINKELNFRQQRKRWPFNDAKVAEESIAAEPEIDVPPNLVESGIGISSLPESGEAIRLPGDDLPVPPVEGVRNTHVANRSADRRQQQRPQNRRPQQGRRDGRR